LKNNSHIAKQVLFGLMLLLFVGNIKSQVGYEKKFLKFFKAQSLAGKVNAFDTLDNDFKEACYPYVKDELEKIREQAIIDHQDEILNKFMKIEAQMFFVRQNYSKAIPLFTDLLAKHKIKSYKDSASVLYCLKNAYIKLHSLNKAIEIHKVMMGLKRRYADIDSWLFHPKLSIIYYEMKMYKECLNQQLLEFDEIKNSKPMLLGYFNNRGLFWQKYGNLDSALMCFNTAKEVFYSFHNNPKLYTIDDEFVLGLIEGNIGQVYIEQKEYKKAIPLLEKDIVSSMNAKDTLNAAVSEIELARCYLNLNQAQLCKKYLDNANAKLQRIEDYKSKLNIIKQYAVYYDKIGAYRQSIDFYNRYINFKDSIELQRKFKRILSAQVASQVDEKEKLIVENQKNIKQKNSEVSKQKTIRNALLFCGVILVIVIVYFVSTKKSKNRKQLLKLKINKLKQEMKLLINLFRKRLISKRSSSSG
jgi:tetratricopeptide (TPR) repeat protein